MKPVVVLATSLAAITQVEGHGGLVIPPCRNNRGNVDLFNFTKATGEQWLSGGSCAVSCAHVPTAPRIAVFAAASRSACSKVTLHATSAVRSVADPEPVLGRHLVQSHVTCRATCACGSTTAALSAARSAPPPSRIAHNTHGSRTARAPGFATASSNPIAKSPH